METSFFSVSTLKRLFLGIIIAVIGGVLVYHITKSGGNSNQIEPLDIKSLLTDTVKNYFPQSNKKTLPSNKKIIATVFPSNCTAHFTVSKPIPFSNNEKKSTLSIRLLELYPKNYLFFFDVVILKIAICNEGDFYQKPSLQFSLINPEKTQTIKWKKLYFDIENWECITIELSSSLDNNKEIIPPYGVLYIRETSSNDKILALINISSCLFN